MSSLRIGTSFASGAGIGRVCSMMGAPRWSSFVMTRWGLGPLGRAMGIRFSWGVLGGLGRLLSWLRLPVRASGLSVWMAVLPRHLPGLLCPASPGRLSFRSNLLILSPYHPNQLCPASPGRLSFRSNLRNLSPHSLNPRNLSRKLPLNAISSVGRGLFLILSGNAALWMGLIVRLMFRLVVSFFRLPLGSVVWLSRGVLRILSLGVRGGFDGGTGAVPVRSVR